MPETQYCGVCGHENVADEERCASCGTLLTSEFNADSSTEGRPIQWRWVEIFFGGMSALLAMVTFVPLVNLVFMHLRFSHSVIVLPGGMITVLPLLMLFVLGGAIMGVVANRAIYREIAIGSLGAVLMLWFFWFVRAGWQPRALVQPVVAVTDSIDIHLPPVLFLVTISIAGMLLAAGSCRVAVMITEKILGRTNCYTCGMAYAIKPKRPLACPGCGTPQIHRGLSWAWAGPTIGATLLIFFLSVTFLGPPLKFYWRCDFSEFSESCKEAAAKYRTDHEDMYYWRGEKEEDGSQPGVVMSPYRYVGLMVPLFFLGPFVIAWRCRKARFKTAGVTLLANWIGATMVAMIGLGFAQFEGVFMLSLRLHMIAGVVWCVAGAVGLGVGSKLSPSLELDEDPDLLD